MSKCDIGFVKTNEGRVEVVIVIQREYFDKVLTKVKFKPFDSNEEHTLTGIELRNFYESIEEVLSDPSVLKF